MKSYNPFLMWGSYVGAIILVILFHFNPLLTYISVAGVPYLPVSYFIIALSILRTASLGFLLGWGIHSLVRFLRR